MRRRTQFQLDVFGELIDAMYDPRLRGLEPDATAWNLELAILEFLETNWQKPDEGIWEIRGGQQQFTHSKMMAWVGLDRAVKSVEKLGMQGPLRHWRSVRKRIHDDVCTSGFNASLNSFVQYYGSDELDASLLMMPLVGFLPISDAHSWPARFALLNVRSCTMASCAATRPPTASTVCRPAKAFFCRARSGWLTATFWPAALLKPRICLSTCSRYAMTSASCRRNSIPAPAATGQLSAGPLAHRAHQHRHQLVSCQRRSSETKRELTGDVAAQQTLVTLTHQKRIAP